MTTAITPAHKEIRITVAVNETALAETLAEAVEEAKDLDGIDIDHHEVAVIVADAASGWASRYDALEALRKEVAQPIDAKKKEVQDIFKPALSAIKKLVDGYRGKLQAYALSEDERKRLERAAAGVLKASGDVQAAAAALARAHEDAPAKVPGAPTSIRWVVDRVEPDLLPLDRDNWVPNLVKFEAHAAAHKGDEPPPPIPGVIFRREASVSIRRAK